MDRKGEEISKIGSKGERNIKNGQKYIKQLSFSGSTETL